MYAHAFPIASMPSLVAEHRNTSMLVPFAPPVGRPEGHCQNLRRALRQVAEGVLRGLVMGKQRAGGNRPGTRLSEISPQLLRPSCFQEKKIARRRRASIVSTRRSQLLQRDSRLFTVRPAKKRFGCNDENNPVLDQRADSLCCRATYRSRDNDRACSWKAR